MASQAPAPAARIPRRPIAPHMVPLPAPPPPPANSSAPSSPLKTVRTNSNEFSSTKPGLKTARTDSGLSTTSTLTNGSTSPISPSTNPLLGKLGHPGTFQQKKFLDLLGHGSEAPSYPHPQTVFRILCIFIAFVVVILVAARLPTKASWVLIMAVGPLCSIALIIDYARNYISHRQKEGFYYRPNLGNTIAIVLLTVPMFTVLYLKLWYPNLRTDILVTTTDIVDKVQFPSIALFQRVDWSSQANLRSRHGGPSGSKCYLGWYNDSAPQCSTLSPETFGNSTECTCRELWYNNDQVIENWEWMNTTYRYIAFDSLPWLITNTPTYMLLLQTFFDYNVTKAFEDSSTWNPSLSLAVYDPALGMQKSFEQGYTRMRLINANGIVAVNVGLWMRQAPGYEPAYDYPLDISNSQAANITCDTSTNTTFQGACHVSLFITIPNFERTITTRQKQMGWSDVVASAGAYFSFVQFISWIISAQAFQG